MADLVLAARRRRRWINIKDNAGLYLFVLPGIVITFVFHYVPIYGVQIAFRNFSLRRGFWGSEWVGLAHFLRFFNSPNFAITVWNTFALSAYSLFAGFPIPIILALLLNAFKHKRYRRVIQTVTYAPNFISVVVMSGMLLLFLSPRVGFVNGIISAVGGTPINFMAEQGMWRHIYVWSGIWQGAGWSSVIYFAALAGVSPEYYEAAIIDGATKFQRIIHIDLFFIIPTATLLLILNFGSILSVGFEKAYLLQNPLNLRVSEIISTYVYKVGLLNRDLSFSAAIGLFNSIVNSILLITVNRIVRQVSEYGLW